MSKEIRLRVPTEAQKLLMNADTDLYPDSLAAVPCSVALGRRKQFSGQLIVKDDVDMEAKDPDTHHFTVRIATSFQH